MELLLAIAALLFIAMWWAGVRDRYDRWHWRLDPEYPRYGATHAEVFRWWRSQKGILP